MIFGGGRIESMFLFTVKSVKSVKKFFGFLGG